MNAPLALDALNDYSYQPPTLPDLWSLAVLADHWAVWAKLLFISSVEDGQSCPVCIYLHHLYAPTYIYIYVWHTYIHITYIIAIYLGLPPYTHSSAYTYSKHSHHCHAHAPQNTFSRYVQTCIYHLYHLDDRHTYALISMHVDMLHAFSVCICPHSSVYMCHRLAAFRRCLDW